MDSEVKTQKKVDRLARVRENQRKSRARKQEYVRELEQRLATFKEEAQQRDIANRIAIQKVEAENRHLRNLLASLGVSAASVNHHLQLADQDTAADHKVAIPMMKRPAEASPTSSIPSYDTACSTSSQRTCSASSVPTPDPVGQPVAKESVLAPACSAPCPVPVSVPAQELTIQQKKCSVPSLCQSTAEQGDSKPQCGSESQAPDEDVLNTTLCAIAEELITQYNTRGVDLDEIRRRICAEFKKGTENDCCRVQNNLLFQVLDEISNDI